MNNKDQKLNNKLLGGGISFFCAAYNDIDHITPIIYKLKKTKPALVIELVIYDVRKTYFDDFRLVFLKSIGVDIFHFLELIISKNRSLNRFFNENEKLDKKIGSPLRGKLMNRLFLEPKKKEFNKLLYSYKGDFFIKNCFVTPPKVVVFDQCYNKWSKNLVNSCKSMGIITVAVPHGHNILENEMIWNQSMDIYPGQTSTMGQMHYDYVVFENYLVTEKYKKLGIVNDDQAVVLGSTRFSNEWMKKIREIIPSNPPKTPLNTQLKVVIMLSKPSYNGCTDELIRSITFISKFPGVFLIVKPHTRRKRFDHLNYIKNIYIDNSHEYDSPNLIDWADVIFFEHSCICFDSIKQDKPTIYLKNTHANRLMSESIFNSWEVHCRDDIRTFMWRFLKDKNYRPYTKEHMKKFCKEVIEPAGSDVLNDYVNFLSRFLTT
jgi:hypothetical protein